MTAAPTLHFTAPVQELKDWLIIRLPDDISKQLSSRGQVATELTLGDQTYTIVLEPDGYWGHWFRLTDELQQASKLQAGDSATIDLTVTKNWPEPEIPADVAAALATAPDKVKDKWIDITPMARWEWLRWINETAVAATRQIRIEKTISKLDGKHRRPCCFNLAACTEPYVAKSGRLISAAPDDAK